MPIPWICRICGKRAFNRIEMCTHLQEGYEAAFIGDHAVKDDANANNGNNNDSLVENYIYNMRTGSQGEYVIP